MFNDALVIYNYVLNQQAINQSYKHFHCKSFCGHHDFNKYASNHQLKCPQKVYLDYLILSLNKIKTDQPQREFYAP